MASIHTIFMFVRTTPAWLALSPPERFAMIRRHVSPVLEAHRGVSMRYFDSEWYSARITDIMVWEASDLAIYRSAVEALRETPIWDVYFQITEIVPAIENAYADHYGVEPLNA